MANPRDAQSRPFITAWTKAAISVFVVLVMAVQVSTQFHYVRVWPFIDYPMYSQAHYPSIETQLIHLYATDAVGNETKIGNSNVGINWFVMQFRYLEPMFDGDQEKTAQMARWVHKDFGEPARSFRLDKEAWRLTDKGVEKTAESKVIRLEEPLSFHTEQ